MDKVAEYNQARSKALTEANALFTRPRLDLDAGSAQLLVDPERLLGDLNGRSVLCLAGGGGQQSAAFALLGARVTVVDISTEQLERDLQVAKKYDVPIDIVHADMRDLSGLEADGFDLVYHPYSLNFVPDSTKVFRQVKHVLRNGGLYWFTCANPFTMGAKQSDWNGAGYSLREPYVTGALISYNDQDWVYDRTIGKIGRAHV